MNPAPWRNPWRPGSLRHALEEIRLFAIDAWRDARDVVRLCRGRQ